MSGLGVKILEFRSWPWNPLLLENIWTIETIFCDPFCLKWKAPCLELCNYSWLTEGQRPSLISKRERSFCWIWWVWTALQFWYQMKKLLKTGGGRLYKYLCCLKKFSTLIIINPWVVKWSQTFLTSVTLSTHCLSSSLLPRNILAFDFYQPTIKWSQTNSYRCQVSEHSVLLWAHLCCRRPRVIFFDGPPPIMRPAGRQKRDLRRHLWSNIFLTPSSNFLEPIFWRHLPIFWIIGSFLSFCHYIPTFFRSEIAFGAIF